MNSKDVKIIIKILKEKNRHDLASLLLGAKGEIDESSTYGAFFFSTISQYLFFVPLSNFNKIRNLPEEDKERILEAVLYLFPHQSESPEIRSIDFRLLRDDNEEDIIKAGNNLDHDFALEQWEKCNEKIHNEDYDGAISSSRSLLEGVFDDIYRKCTGKNLEKRGDLRGRYKLIKPLLKLSDEQYSMESAKSMMQSLSSVVSSIDSLSNQMGDRHLRLCRPWKRHAKLCVNSARIITEFLYETLNFQQGKIEKLYNELIGLLDGYRRLLKKEALLSDKEIVLHLKKYDYMLKYQIKNKFLNEYVIERFRQSDIYFASMQIFFEHIDKEDLNAIFNKNKENSQACGLRQFLGLVEIENPTILNKEMVEYLKNKRREEEISGINKTPF